MVTKRFGISVEKTGVVVGELHSVLAAHRMAHSFLRAWPDLSPLVVVDWEGGDGWRVTLGGCTPLDCDVALRYEPYREWVSEQETLELMNDLEARREIAESQAEYERGEFITGEEARARFGLPVVAESAESMDGRWGPGSQGPPGHPAVFIARTPDAGCSGVTRSGLPVRVPGAAALVGEGTGRLLEVMVDVVVLQRVLGRLRRL
jgi:hypothetical protein